MSSDNPETWSLPPEWAPLHEGEWEFEQLRRFATAVLARDPAYRLHLDAFEDGYLKVDVHSPAATRGPRRCAGSGGAGPGRPPKWPPPCSFG